MADQFPTNTPAAAAAAAAHAANTAATPETADTADSASPSAAPRRTSSHHKPRHVIYKSSNLEETAPGLVARASAETVSALRSIQNANAIAEGVRDSYRSRKDAQLVGGAIVGTDDESNAKKYERRLKMNRQSAAASRVRREAYTKALEAELVLMETNYKKLMELLEKERTSRIALEAEQLEELDAMGGNAFDIAEQGSNADSDDEMFRGMEHGPAEDIDELINGVETGPNLTEEAGDNSALNAPTTLNGMDATRSTEKSEDMLLFADAVFAAQLQLPADLIQILSAPTNPPIPDCFLTPDQASMQDGDAQFFDYPGL